MTEHWENPSVIPRALRGSARSLSALEPKAPEVLELAERILIIDPDDSVREKLEIATVGLAGASLEFHNVHNAAQALDYLQGNAVVAVLCDRRAEGIGGRDPVAQLSDRLSQGSLVLIGDLDRESLAVEARERHAFDCLVKPVQNSEFLLALGRIRERASLRSKQAALNLALEEAENERTIVAASEPMIEVLERLERASELALPVLLTGEPGTRKHLFAQTIHTQSLRRSGPFIAVDCGRSDADILHARLQGNGLHGSGPRKFSNPGLVAMAQGGTLFLSNVNQLSMPLQGLILRLIEEGKLWNDQQNRGTQVDIRVIASSSKDLAQATAQGSFDTKLFDRLHSTQIALPPLRERRKDIPLLIDQFLTHYRRSHGQKPGRLSEEALQRLCQYDWPGNVRELRNVIERAAILAKDDLIDLTHLPHEAVEEYRVKPAESGENFALKPARQAFEARIIRGALNAAGRNRTRAASLLGISHRNLLYKLKAYRIKD